MTAARYHPLLAVLHWALALLILAMLALGFLVIAPGAADDPGRIGVLRVHMATGSLILALMLARVVVRAITRGPQSRPAVALGHLGLYLLVFGLIGTGFATAVLTGLNLVVFGAPGQAIPAGLASFPTAVAHAWLAIALAILVAGHLGQALFHQFIRHKPVFRRVAFGPRFEQPRP